jgi:dolichol kinase
MLPGIAAICATCTVVEALPINTVLDDNLTVPAVAAGLSLLLLVPSGAACC